MSRRWRGGYSASVEGWPLDDSGIIGTPANVVATQGSFTNKVTITWNSASEAVYYNVYRAATANGTYTKINGSNITLTTYDDSTVSCAIHYFYRVTAVNDHGTESGQSAYSEGWAAPTWTNPPTNIAATDGTQAGQITITWTATSGADFYNVYRSSTSGGTYTKVNTSNVTATTYTNTGIAAGAHWFYKITANSTACSAESVMSAYDEGSHCLFPLFPAELVQPIRRMQDLKELLRIAIRPIRQMALTELQSHGMRRARQPHTMYTALIPHPTEAEPMEPIPRSTPRR